MNRGIFITGTDTGIGKTFTAMGLIKAFKGMGVNVCPMKPVESGCKVRNGSLIPADAKALLKASGLDEKIDEINPYRLKHPVAPSVAAEIEGVKIEKKKIISAYKKLCRKYELTLVEGAGGVMVPVYKKYQYLDLIRDMNIPVIVVSRPGLGTINHTLLTLEAIRNNGAEVLGVILNYSVKSRMGLAEKTNQKEIEKLGMVKVLGVVPYAAKADTSRIKSIFNEIATSIIKNY